MIDMFDTSKLEAFFSASEAECGVFSRFYCPRCRHASSCAFLSPSLSFALGEDGCLYVRPSCFHRKPLFRSMFYCN